MGQFNLSTSINPNKVFIINRGEIEGRLEAEYYRPEIRNLENNIRSNSKKKLKDFIEKIASGATPAVTEEDKYYSNKDNGVPFLRVQNLQTNGQLLLDDDLKYINLKTHEVLLKRSQVKENDLLVKITGVGRMAIASVAPQGFEGNTNQHMVVIKTKAKEISEYLANYLNLDIAEKLATRRSTGATRPALDYPALKSIPIIENIDFTSLYQAEAQKKEKDTTAQDLMNSIDEFLLKELKIEIPEVKKNLHQRIFLSKFKEVTGGRIDSYYNSAFFQDLHKCILKGKYPVDKLVHICKKITDGTHHTPNYVGSGVRFISVKNIKAKEIDFSDIKYVELKDSEKLNKRVKPQENDILLTKIGTIGNTCVVDKSDLPFNIFVSVALIRLNDGKINPHYISEILSSQICRFQYSRHLKGVGVPDLHLEDIEKTLIPLPPIETQNRIASEINFIRKQAKLLKIEGASILNAAKKRIETTIINHLS